MLAHGVKKEIENHKGFLAAEYAKGNISYQELVQYIGKEDAEIIELGISKVKEAITEAKEVSKKLKR